MPRWRRVLKGMLGMGLTFSLGVGAVASLAAGIAWLIPGIGGDVELFRMAAASAVWAFPIGVAFSGAMALGAGGRRFAELSLPRFAALGAGAGLLLFGALAANAWSAWTIDTAIANAVILVGLGSGAATATLLMARRAQPSLEPGGDQEVDHLALPDGATHTRKADEPSGHGSP